jgi:hypothetical protein
MKLMTKIKELIFGKRREPVEPMSTGLRTMKPENQPSYQEWCKEFRVSMMYDRKAIHLTKN